MDRTDVPSTMRRFELVDAASSKFWEIEVDGPVLTVRFGRIGTPGQAKVKSLGSDAEARREHDKLVKEKTGKGYAEVGEPTAPVPAPAVPVAPAAVQPEAPAPARPAPPVADPALADKGFPQPSGGFRWNDELRDALPVLRGVHVPPLPDVAALLERPLVLPGDIGLYQGEIRVLNRHAGGSWGYWGTARSLELIRREVLAGADQDFWVDLCVQFTVAQFDTPAGRQRGRASMSYRYGLQWAAEVGAHLRGLPFMAGLLLALAPRFVGSAFWGRVVHSMLPVLRHAVAAAGEAEHAELLDVLGQTAGATPLQRLLRATLCPHREDWVLDALADGSSDKHLLLAECRMSPGAAVAYLRQFPAHLPRIKPALLLQVHLHGDGALPVLADMLQRAADEGDDRRLLAAMLADLQCPALPPVLVSLMAGKEARGELDRLAKVYPAAVLKAAIEHAHASGSRDAEGWALQLALREPEALAQAKAALPADSRDRFLALLASMRASEAPQAALPALLRDPPWLRKARAKPLPVLEVGLPDKPGRLTWPDPERERHADCGVSRWRPPHAAGMSDLDYAFHTLGIRPGAREKLLAGGPLQPDQDLDEPRHRHGVSQDVLLLLPDSARLAVWNGYPARRWGVWYETPAVVRALLARHGAAALPGFGQFALAHAELGLDIAAVADCPLVTPAALNALRRLKRARPLAIAWLRACAATALPATLAQAFGKAGKAEREDAQFGLRWYLSNGFEAQARAAAAAHGSAMAQALQALADADPLLVLPARMPVLPPFVVAPALPRPMLREGRGALPAAAMEHLASMLAISDLEAPYGGLGVVREICTPESLAAFAWGLFEAWLAHGAAPKEAWAYRALGLLGDDDTARRLTPMLRDWPSEGQHQRAAAGLDLLAAIGSDVALMHLHGIASKARNKPLQLRAQEKIAAVAEARGFSADELADRLVPDLGLDEDGTLRLDFGPRAFTVAFDETLKPFVRDADGVRLKDLPKPVRADDAALADAATERFKRLKKDAKAIAALQVLRLERAMVERRRWSAGEFRMFFLDHPLMRHLARRLAWGAYADDGPLLTAFRVAEDFSLADAEDMAYTLPAQARVGVAHVLEMPASLQAALGQVFADYEILQPFRQLGRETCTLTEPERAATQITRYAGKVVATGSVLGLAERGWDRGRDDGWIGSISRPLGDGLEAVIELDPGTHVGDPAGTPRQRIPAITLRRAGTWGSNGQVPFGQLHLVAASEVLRSVDLLAPLKE
jgi:predicted DNA-binding WGR domain protein